MIELSDIEYPLKAELDRFNQLFKESLSNSVEIVDALSGYVLSMQGKHMRPLFLLLSGALHGEINDKCYNSAIFIELVHTASLIHDDVVDEAYMRRSKWSTNALVRSKSAVLLGDYIIARGLKIASQNKLYATFDMVSNVIEEMSVGELIQSNYAIKLNATKKEYFDVIRRKTALLMACCGASGAMAVGADQESVDRMFKFGELLGVAFQIKDDIIDLNSDLTSGKGGCNDIRERKLTLPLLSVFENCSLSDKRRILSLLREPIISDKSVVEIRDYVLKQGGVESATEQMNALKKEAIELLDIYKDSDIKNSLIMYADFILTRTK